MTPEISLVVPSHGRPLRLRWLLNALEEQTLARDRWELIVVTDDAEDATEDLLRTHPLADAGVLRYQRLEPGTGSPSRQRNVGWRLARAPLVAFTDDDCRTDRGWLEGMLVAAQAAPGAIVQGTTRPEPHESAILVAPRTRTLDVTPPVRECPTCNILYPRVVLEAVGGFDELFPGAAGEDTDLAERARTAGAGLVAAPDAVVFHAVEAFSLLGKARLTWKWQALPAVVKRHPQLRERGAVGGIFWKHSHWRLLIALAGMAAGRRHPARLALSLPYLRHALFVHGRRPQAVVRAAVELPGRVVVDGVEIAAVVRGSVRYRTVLL